MTRPLPIVILVSGRGSNMQAIVEAARAGSLPVEVRAVIGNRADAPGLAWARQAGIDVAALDPADYPDREAYDRAMMGLIDRFEPALVVLAGYMRILSPAFVHHYEGRLLNIHPSLLPAFRGLDTHRRALEAGHDEHGASVHFVTEELDGGPVIAQVRVPVEPGDDEQTLAARVLEQEHRLYPEVLRWFAAGRLGWRDGQVLLDGEPLRRPVDLGRG